jgi:hypothetical protein
MPVLDLKDTTIYIKDAGANGVEAKLGEGNLTYSEKRNIEYHKNRGVLDLTREGDEEPIEVSMDFTWEWLKSSVTAGDPPTPLEALKGIGAASGWASAGGACEPYAVDIEIVYDPDCGTTESEHILLSEFRWEQLDYDAQAGAVSVSGKCNITDAILTRA